MTVVTVSGKNKQVGPGEAAVPVSFWYGEGLVMSEQSEKWLQKENHESICNKEDRCHWPEDEGTVLPGVAVGNQ